MALTPAATASSPRCALTTAVVTAAPDTTMRHPDLEMLRLGNAAARALPLLAAIAAGNGGRVLLPYVGQSSLAIEVTGALHPVFSSALAGADP
jgi:hypothetical protein